MKPLRVCLFLFSSFKAEVFKFEWVVGRTSVSPDNFTVNVPTINGQLPGPIVRVTAGSEIEVHLKNELEHPLTIHWHGLLQKGTPTQDGVPYISQDPIPANSNYTYRFSTGEQTGTYFYHSHTGLDGTSVFGALIIEDKPQTLEKLRNYNRQYEYDKERMIILSDHWHIDLDQALKNLVTSPHLPVADPGSFLINGKGSSKETSNIELSEKYTLINVEANTKYRLRIIGAQYNSFYRFQIPNHKLTVIEFGGAYVDPFSVDYLDINSGSRYSVILQTQSKPMNSFIYVQNIDGGTQDVNGIGILKYENSTLQQNELIVPPAIEAMSYEPRFEDQIKSSPLYKATDSIESSYYPIPQEIDEELIFNSTVSISNEVHFFKINGVELQDRNSSLADIIKSNPDYKEPGIYNIKANNKGKQFVIQQFTFPGHACMQHPWHLHGHSFYIVGSGPGIYNPQVDSISIQNNIQNLNSPLIDTFSFLPLVNHSQSSTDASDDNPESEVNSCGWYAIRFRADNPGLWKMHCHIAIHMIMGKRVVINAMA